NLTSSDVTGSPLDHLTPSRSFSVQLNASGAITALSSRKGFSSPLGGRYSYRFWKMAPPTDVLLPRPEPTLGSQLSFWKVSMAMVSSPVGAFVLAADAAGLAGPAAAADAGA